MTSRSDVGRRGAPAPSRVATERGAAGDGANRPEKGGQVDDLFRQALRRMPPDAKIWVAFERDDLLRALEDAGENPDRFVTTVWLSERFGMSREWWAERAASIPGSFQDREGAPWNIPIGAARAHLDEHVRSRGGHRHRTTRRRGPRGGRGAGGPEKR